MSLFGEQVIGSEYMNSVHSRRQAAHLLRQNNPVGSGSGKAGTERVAVTASAG